MVHLSIYASHCFNTTSQKQPQLKKGMNKMSAFLMHLLIQAIMWEITHWINCYK